MKTILPQNFVLAEVIILLGSAISVSGGGFYWDHGRWQLNDINLEIDGGQLVAVVGAVGAGKSSLIAALLGEMERKNGKIVVNVGIVYLIFLKCCSFIMRIPSLGLVNS